MLTPELVRARVVQGELVLNRLSPKLRQRAQLLLDEYLLLAREHVGSTRERLRAAWNLVPVTPGERRLAEGLLKLIEDAADFGNDVKLEPASLRRQVFLEASRQRQEAGLDQPFDRQKALEVSAREHGVSAEAVEEALYADLKGAQRLKSLAPLSSTALLERYELGQVQAVLLRAVDVVADVFFHSPLGYRQLFNKLKFRRLLYQIETLERGYRVRLDGPFSLFESVTKYGMQLALVFPALLECDELSLTASLRWGKARRPVVFRLTHRGSSQDYPAPALTDEVERLKDQLSERARGWRITTSQDVLDLPGVGVCVPDLVFEKRDTRVYLEVLGYWSRDAVWRRVEMAERGLRGAKVLFAVSSRLRVSEEVLADSESAALYVFKGVMSPVQVLDRVEALAGR